MRKCTNQFHTVDYYNEDRDTAVGLHWPTVPDKDIVCGVCVSVQYAREGFQFPLIV